MLNVLTLDEAKDILLRFARPTGRTQSVSIEEAVGRVLAENVCSVADVPGFDRSTVDGLAVRASDTFGASDSIPAMLQLVGSVLMGRASDVQIKSGECAVVPTGGALPAGADAMVMIEYVETLGDGLMLVNRPSSPGDHLILRGDDFKTGQLVLPAGQVIRTADIGTLAALDVRRVVVYERPRVAIISTGDELVPLGHPLTAGLIHDLNSPALAALVRQSGGEPVLYGIIADRPELLERSLEKARRECDLILISGGSSVGEKDHLHTAIEAQGEPGILFHGIAVKPGKPTLAGVAGKCIMLGLPGHPLAAWFMAWWLAQPLLFALQGAAIPERDTVSAKLSCRVPSNAGRESIIPVRLRPDPADRNRWLAEPVFTKSGLITVLSQSDGCIRISRDREGLEADTSVRVYRFN